MSNQPKFSEIYGKGFGCFATIDIKKDSLILEEKDWQIPVELEAEEMGSSRWIKKLWKYFKDMIQTDQFEYMTLPNKCDEEIINTSLDLKSKISKIQQEKEEKMLKVCCIYVSYNTYKCKNAEAEVMGSSKWIKILWNSFKKLSKPKQNDYLRHINICDEKLILELDLKSKINKIQQEKAEPTFKVCCIYISYRMEDGLMIKTSKFKHSCNPTASTRKEPKFQIIADVDIKKGQPIKINWCNLSAQNIENEKNPFISREHFIVSTCEECNVKINDQIEHYIHKSGQKRSVEVKPDEVKPVEVKPVEVKTVEVKPVEVKPVENTNQFICEFCSKDFQSQADVQVHISTDHETNRQVQEDNQQYQCPLCLSKFSKSFQLDIHYAEVHETIDPVHEGKKSHACTACDKAFVCMFELNKHILDDHNPVHKCSLCNSKFLQKATLECHIKEVHGESLNRCSLCSRTFSNIENLNAHIASVHEAKKPAKAAQNRYKCEICDKNFSRLDNVKRHHRQVHESKRDYECEICKKKFQQKQGLQEHHTRVHGKKIVKETKNKSNVQKSPKRRKVCQDGNSFQCPDCKLTFGTDELFEKHKSNRHRLPCWFCRLLFIRDTHLQQHITSKSLSEALIFASTNP